MSDDDDDNDDDDDDDNDDDDDEHQDIFASDGFAPVMCWVAQFFSEAEQEFGQVCCRSMILW